MRRAILEMGAGTDLHGGDYTKAAVRAVKDALQHSSLSFIRALDLDPESMHVQVTIGVQQPAQVDPEAVRATLPHGQVTVSVVHGGMDVPDPERDDRAVVASAALEVRIPVPAAD